MIRLPAIRLSTARLRPSGPRNRLCDLRTQEFLFCGKPLFLIENYDQPGQMQTNGPHCGEHGLNDSVGADKSLCNCHPIVVTLSARHGRSLST